MQQQDPKQAKSSAEPVSTRRQALKAVGIAVGTGAALATTLRARKAQATGSFGGGDPAAD